YEHGPETFMFVAHVEHDRAIAELHGLALASAAVCRRAHGPRAAVVAARHDRREFNAFRVTPLHGHHERAVRKVDSLLRRRREEPPFSWLELTSQVHRLGPGAPIVFRADHKNLGGFANFVAWRRSVTRPLMLAGIAVHPHGEAENLAGLTIDNDARIAATVLLLGKSAVFPHVHDDAHQFPRLSAVAAAAENDVDVLLKIAAHASAHVI